MIIQGKKNWFMLVTLVFLIAVAGEVWVSKAALAAPTTKPRTLRMMMGTEFPHLDRVVRTGSPGEPVWENVLEPLIKLGKAGEHVPMLATKWNPSADLTKWRFNLRKGVKFHNGADFTARDVVETAKYIISVKDISDVYVRVPVEEAVAIDDYTVDLIFKTPQPLLLINLEYFLIYPTAIARDNREQAKTSVIGTGPYKFVSWNRGLSVQLSRFEGYWGPKPQIGGMVLTWRGEAGVRMAALQVGEADWIDGLSPEMAKKAPQTVVRPGIDTVWMSIDESVQTNPIFADKRLRLALEYTIDRKALIALYGGYAIPSQAQFASPGDFGFNPGLKNRPYDLEKAKALVREAGAVGRTVVLVGMTGRWAKDRDIAEAVAFMIEKTGLKVKLMLLPKDEADNYKKRSEAVKGFYSDLFIMATDTLLEVESRLPRLFAEGGQNFFLNDLEPTRMFKEVLAEFNIPRRGEKLAKAWAYLYEQAHYVPLFKLPLIWGVSKNLEWKPHLAGKPYLPDMRFTD